MRSLYAMRHTPPPPPPAPFVDVAGARCCATTRQRALMRQPTFCRRQPLIAMLTPATLLAAISPYAFDAAMLMPCHAAPFYAIISPPPAIIFHRCR